MQRAGLTFKVRLSFTSEDRREAEADCNLRRLNESRQSDKENKGEVDESIQTINAPGESRGPL